MSKTGVSPGRALVEDEDYEPGFDRDLHGLAGYVKRRRSQKSNNSGTGNEVPTTSQIATVSTHKAVRQVANMVARQKQKSQVFHH